MIIDTSAFLAILFGEVDATRYGNAIAAGRPRRMSAVALREATMVVEGRGGASAGQALDTVLEKASIELVAVAVNLVREFACPTRGKRKTTTVRPTGRAFAPVSTTLR